MDINVLSAILLCFSRAQKIIFIIPLLLLSLFIVGPSLNIPFKIQELKALCSSGFLD